MKQNSEGDWQSVQSFSVNLLKNKSFEFLFMVANPRMKQNGILERVTKRVVDLSGYVEYKNQEYILTIVCAKYGVDGNTDINVKIVNKQDLEHDSKLDIFDGDELRDPAESFQSSKHKFL
jgi:hypothetical protein